MNKKVMIVGEMHNDLFYTCDFFKGLITAIAKWVHNNKSKLEMKYMDEIEKNLACIFESIPKKIPGTAMIKRGG
ncbi:MAG: hypothetical protein ACTSWN_13440, partial [Promethearchaeota archaeon]